MSNHKYTVSIGKKNRFLAGWKKFDSLQSAINEISAHDVLYMDESRYCKALRGKKGVYYIEREY